MPKEDSVEENKRNLQMVQDYIHTDMSVGDIAKKNNISKQRVSQIFKELEFKPGNKTKSISECKKEKFLAMYKEGKFIEEILEELKIPIGTIRNYARILDLPQPKSKVTTDAKIELDKKYRNFMFDYREGFSHKQLSEKYNYTLLSVSPMINRMKKLGY